MSKYWFKPKQFGLGATPSTWEGWVATGVFIASLIGIGTAFPPDHRPFAFFTLAALSALTFVVLAWSRTEGGWHSRWGGD